MYAILGTGPDDGIAHLIHCELLYNPRTQVHYHIYEIFINSYSDALTTYREKIGALSEVWINYTIYVFGRQGTCRLVAVI